MNQWHPDVFALAKTAAVGGIEGGVFSSAFTDGIVV
jgi:hypothetical protein